MGAGPAELRKRRPGIGFPAKECRVFARNDGRTPVGIPRLRVKNHARAFRIREVRKRLIRITPMQAQCTPAMEKEL